MIMILFILGPTLMFRQCHDCSLKGISPMDHERNMFSAGRPVPNKLSVCSQTFMGCLSKTTRQTVMFVIACLIALLVIGSSGTSGSSLHFLHG